MNELALFAGAGGGLLGSRLLGWKTVCAVEIEPYCREVLLRRQRDGVLDLFPIWDDVRTFDGKPWRGLVDVVTAGFPCPAFSSAGKRRGGDDPRNMWPATIRIIREVEPPFAFLENVAALLNHEYAHTVFGDLAESGMHVRWDCVPASSIGAPHERDRLWILAYSGRSEGEQRPDADLLRRRSRKTQYAGVGSSGMDDSNVERRAEGRLHIRPRRPLQTESVAAWDGEIVRGQDGRCRKVKPGLPLLVDGVAYGMDRLEASGNGQVPAVVRAAWRLLTGAEEPR